MKIQRFERSALFGRLHSSFAAKGGRPALRDRPRPWLDLNGFGFQVGRSHWWIEFRRHR